MNALYEDVRVLLYTLWRRRWLALGVAWAVCLTGWLAVSLIPNRYESRARLFVQMQSLLSSKVGITDNDAQRGIDRVRQTLTSSENMIKVVKTTELARQISTDADAARYAATLAQDIRIVATPDNFFEISAQTSFGGLSDAANARLAHDVVTRLIDLFVEANLSDDRTETNRSIRFFDEELARREKGLREAESRKALFDQKYLGSIPGTGSIDQRVEALRGELMSLEPSLASAQSSLAAANAQMADTPATIATPGVASGAGGRLAALEAQLADAQAKGWTDRHPDVRAIRAQIARIQSTGASTAVIGGSAPNPVYMSMRAMQAEKQAAAAALAARKGQIEADLRRLRELQITQPGIAAEQARLSRDYEVLKAQYDKLIADREDVRLRGTVAGRADAIEFRVIQPPTLSRIPASPNRPLLLFGVLIAGVGAGLGAAFAMAQVKTSYPTADRLAAATGLPVLGAIPRTFTAAEAADRQQKLKWFAGAGGALAGAFVLLILVEFIQRGLGA